MNFIFCALRHPEVQAKAQREIDSVVGPDRLPSLADRASMPYVEAVVQESLRWQPPFPIPALRMSKEDDVYKGMYIPKGTIILVNDAGMAKDTRVYKNPESFNPDRYMPVETGGNGEPFFNPYGYGRRICPGRHVSDTAVWMAISALLASCVFSPAKDKHGMAILPRIEYGDTLSVVYVRQSLLQL
ncbi:cytochrome P450 [Cylindrobasidium torrendii FP15055 ss-10]|uniref:Cytochrome P450 n=1 Tax=Cylindrobasidium torrendii FP15055 ss-10 TaxID=1314674 RepID=A0A0D7BJ77_9AGAR|nr:cytochrome P450 [Cylindrobasidium torrendii FP15055 ss-10]